mmetsp:Transcript_34409/g.109899  ORF Transcript_34409/g.109899 Transcript_34409/m.109899 type:complete len:246 (+) Transcript_34409:1274-2011(+)
MLALSLVPQHVASHPAGGGNCGASQLPPRQAGTGFRRHAPPAGTVPLDTSAAGARTSPPPPRRSVEAASAKGRWLAWKHSSVSGADAGQRRYAYPPPWLAAMPHPTSTTPPARQEAGAELASGGSSEPRAPHACPGGGWPPGAELSRGAPPATPQASRTGAAPGERHGCVLVQSVASPIPKVRKRSGRVGAVAVGQWSTFASPVQLAHPAAQPWLNHWHAHPRQPPVQYVSPVTGSCVQAPRRSL